MGASEETVTDIRAARSGPLLERVGAALKREKTSITAVAALLATSDANLVVARRDNERLRRELAERDELLRRANDRLESAARESARLLSQRITAQAEKLAESFIAAETVKRREASAKALEARTFLDRRLVRLVCGMVERLLDAEGIELVYMQDDAFFPSDVSEDAHVALVSVITRDSAGHLRNDVYSVEYDSGSVELHEEGAEDCAHCGNVFGSEGGFLDCEFCCEASADRDAYERGFSAGVA